MYSIFDLIWKNWLPTATKMPILWKFLLLIGAGADMTCGEVWQSPNNGVAKVEFAITLQTLTK